MKFYRENNINPAASCLPLLAQLPVFFALFFVLKDFSKQPAAGRRSAGSEIVPSIAEPANSTLVGLHAARDLRRQPGRLDVVHVDDDAQGAAVLMMVLPLVFIGVVAHFPAGLVLYWVTTNLWTVGQGLDHAAARAEDAARRRRRHEAAPEAAAATRAATARARSRAEAEARADRRSRSPQQPRAREAQEGRRAQGERAGASRSRRPARPSGRRSGRRCASSSGSTPVARQGGRALPGAVGGRARAARRRLHAGARAGERRCGRRRRELPAEAPRGRERARGARARRARRT